MEARPHYSTVGAVTAAKVQISDLMLDQRAEEAERLARQVLAAAPQDEFIRYQLALSLLLQGRYREGFREHEIREHRAKCPARQVSYPEWDGPLAGRSILIWGEQGIGDEIQMARFVPVLRELGASRITVTCWPQSVRAFEQLGADLVVSRFGAVSVPKHDCWISAMSLPYRLGLELRDVSGAPYLQAEPSDRGGIGLVERGRPDNPKDAIRSLPPGLLQAAVPNGRLLEPAGDILDSLQRLAGLDLLITVDTSWAHMAGALGVPCWVLLAHQELDWRWMRERTDSPWYGSMRLFRQPSAGDWGPVLEAVRDALRTER